ncbi:MAG: tetratricopeptide repeat protein [candidate division Zixibacteria bacterium]|nr:tetratricopeptide repeat protein [candidate division Zixibacteria bacterium]
MRTISQALEKFNLIMFEEAIEEFKKAIEVDSTFALPYMRIGMSYALRGRGQQGTSYFEAALRLEDNLPLKERNLLDIYADVWLRTRFDDAVVKMETFVANYPEDKEARSFYAILLHALIRESDAALAQLDTVMMLNPRYQLGLFWYMNIHQGLKNYDKAIEYAQLFKLYYPDSPTAYATLSSIYFTLSRMDEAIEESKQLLQKFPENSSAAFRLAGIYMQNRDFENARHYIELVREQHSDDPYLMRHYFSNLANLASWTGKFQTSMKYQFKALKQARLTGDSTIISSQYSIIASNYYDLHMPDSAIHFGLKGYQWATQFQSMNYPVMLVIADHLNAPVAKPLFTQALKNFKERMPSEMWVLGDNLKNIFEGYCQTDTGAIIDAWQVMAEDPSQQSTSDIETLGRLMVLSGRYDEGKRVLEQLTSGPQETISGLYYLRTLYYIGRADEALGNTKEAIAKYKEVLEYWGEPEIDLKEIIDTRQRLSKLAS